jgi:hypothetical protein
VPGVRKACNFLAGYSLECFFGDTEKAVDELLRLGEPREPEEEILYYVPRESTVDNERRPLP